MINKKKPPVRIVRSTSLGYCMGVSRAVGIAEALLRERAPSLPVYTYGALIHNKTVLARLAESGLCTLDGAALENADLSGKPVVLRAHGVPPAAQEDLRRRGAVIHDATCPKVKANQLLAQRLCQDGYVVFLAGDRAHAEIKGILGYAPDCIIVSSAAEAEPAADAALAAPCPMALIAQTTFPSDDYKSIAEALHRRFPHIEVKDTICPATQERQEALRRLCGEVNAVVIAGGRESANTRALAGIVQNCGKPAFLAEDAKDAANIANNIMNTIKVTARTAMIAGGNFSLCLASGASTPLSIVNEIEAALLGALERAG